MRRLWGRCARAMRSLCARYARAMRAYTRAMRGGGGQPANWLADQPPGQQGANKEPTRSQQGAKKANKEP